MASGWLCALTGDHGELDHQRRGEMAQAAVQGDEEAAAFR